MDIRDLKVGQFAERNESIVYRYQKSQIQLYPFADGLFIVQQSPEFRIWQNTPRETIAEKLAPTGQIGHDANGIEVPQKKHVDNAIKMLKDYLNRGQIDNLTYVENYHILKNYLKPVIVKTEE